jgi:formylglycine-generating enzyme required for sulfatase activity
MTERKPLASGTVIEAFTLAQPVGPTAGGALSVHATTPEALTYFATDTSGEGPERVLIREFCPEAIAKRRAGKLSPGTDAAAKAAWADGLDAFRRLALKAQALRDRAFPASLDLIEANGTLYWVADRPEGVSLASQIARDGPASPALVRSWLAVLLPALQAAHASELVLGEITPDTLVRFDDGYPGYATLFNAEVFSGGSGVPRRSHAVGAYAAPETAGADPHHPGTRTVSSTSDVYALAASMVFLLTGEAPTSAPERHAAMAAGGRDPLGFEPLVARIPGDAELIAALSTALRLDPEWRTPTAAALLAKLENAPPAAQPAQNPVAAAAVATQAAGQSAANALAARMAGLSTARVGPFSLRDLATFGGLAAGVLCLSLLFSWIGGLSSPAPTTPIPVAAVPAVNPDVAAAEAALGPDTTELFTPVEPLAPPPAADTVPGASETEEAAWLAVDRDNADAVRAFLTTAKPGLVRVVAEERLALLDATLWAQASAANDVDTFRLYLESFPRSARPAGRRAADAERRIRELEREEARLVTEARRLMADLGYPIALRGDADVTFVDFVRDFERTAGLPVTGQVSDTLIATLRVSLNARRQAERTAAASSPQSLTGAGPQLRPPAPTVAAPVTASPVVAPAVTAPPVTAPPVTPPAVAAAPTPRPAPVSSAAAPTTSPAEVLAAVPSGRRPVTTAAAPSSVASAEAPSRSAQRGSPRAVGARFRDCPTCPEMLVLEAASFTMGSNSREEGRTEAEGPTRNVRIQRPFALGLTEVTRAQYEAFVSDTGHPVPGGCSVESAEAVGVWEPSETASLRAPGFDQTGEHPVVCVSWSDAQAYVAWLSRRTGEPYRLLSEAEWEYAARAGSTGARFWGRSADTGCRFVNGADETARVSRPRWVTAACDDGYLFTSPAGTMRANAFGVHDTVGNVWEWVEDCFVRDYTGAPSDGSARVASGCATRVIRGGSWASSPDQLRAAKRSGDRPGERYNILGFRVARDVGG